MAEELKTLLQIQDRDLKIRSLLASKEDLRRAVREINEKIASEEAELARLREEGKREMVKIKERELEAEEKRNLIAKYEKQLYQIKNNREYQALLEEIKTLKADIGTIEDAALEVMEQLEGNRAALKEEEEKLAADRETAVRKESEAAAAEAEIEDEVERLTAEKRELAAHLDEELFSKYSRILANKPGRALVAVVNRVCRGCNMKLTAQVNNDLYREGSILCCENCGRLIYLGGHPAPPPAAGGE